MFKLLIILGIVYSILQFGLGVDVNQHIKQQLIGASEQAKDHLPELTEQFSEQIKDALSSGNLEELLQNQDVSIENLTDMLEEKDISMDKLNELLDENNITGEAAKEKLEKLKQRIQEKMEDNN